jgi:hypothetical protein
MKMKSPLLAPEEEHVGEQRPLDLRMGVMAQSVMAAVLLLFGSIGHIICLFLYFVFGIRTTWWVAPANALLFAGAVSGVLSAGYAVLYLLLPEWIAKKDTGKMGVLTISVIFCAAYELSLPYFLSSPYLVFGGLPSQIVK